ncbi:MAG TPA: cysteine desulfurase family protein [Bacteroidales bacterium]|nr:cysteine desulfurase family protein [Bacteroidales bacterium]HPT01803.1 cysteine desulfurase family protein [Bacteroidales bacterium]
MKSVYLDNAATTPLDEQVLQLMDEVYRKNFGNASSNHRYGTEAKYSLNRYRSRLAEMIQAKPEEIIFTSGGTESNNLALKGVAFANRHRGNHIIVSAIEHDCILNTCKWLGNQGFIISYIPVGSDGIVDTGILERMINPKTILVSVMHANNEIGTIQPVEEIGRICCEKNVLFHSDACQSFGKIPVNVEGMQVSLLSLNAHKIYGPKGVGCLYVRKNTPITPLLHGGGQEFGIRSTTENLPGIAGFVKAAELCQEEMENEPKRLATLRDQMIDELQEEIEGFYVNGSLTHRLPQNLNFGISGLEGETMRLLLLLDEAGIAVSAGSACSNNDSSKSASHVLQAIGKNQFEARGAVRVSLGRFNQEDDIRWFLDSLRQCIRHLNPIFS